MLCTPTSTTSTPHLPSQITSTGSLKYFRPSRRPAEAGTATNCLSCAHEPACIYSAKKIYLDKHLSRGLTDWPVKVVVPDIEDTYLTQGPEAARTQLLTALAQDYNESTPLNTRNKTNYFGRCVWASDNDVVDDQIVTLSWDDASPSTSNSEFTSANPSHGPKTAVFHMIAHTSKQCERRGTIYGTTGELTYDSLRIQVHDFATSTTTTHIPHSAAGGGGHGGGDAGLVRQFLGAVVAVEKGVM